MAGDQDHIGPQGEKLAGKYLRQQGMRLLARNYRCPAGEIDLIADDAGTVVFVEVKTRRAEALGDIEEAVNADKRRRVARAARYFLRQTRLDDRPCRFDVIAVLLPKEAEPTIRHTPDAFVPR